ncbi:hypothetical protein FJZ31_41430 [Candidatus Poribacteria bacterium]|nr:hypothetical protein [Candidatus Poribacteria bacterium]
MERPAVTSVTGQPTQPFSAVTLTKAEAEPTTMPTMSSKARPMPSSMDSSSPAVMPMAVMMTAAVGWTTTTNPRLL